MQPNRANTDNFRSKYYHCALMNGQKAFLMEAFRYTAFGTQFYESKGFIINLAILPLKNFNRFKDAIHIGINLLNTSWGYMRESTLGKTLQPGTTMMVRWYYYLQMQPLNSEYT